MPRHLLIGIVVLSAAWALNSASLHAEEAKDLKVIAKANDLTGFENKGPVSVISDELVIRNAEQLAAASKKAASAKEPAVQKEMEAALAKVLKVDAIDWTKQMVIVCLANGIDSVKSDGKTATVTYVPLRPLRAPGYPMAIVLVERVEGDVKFVKKK